MVDWDYDSSCGDLVLDHSFGVEIGFRNYNLESSKIEKDYLRWDLRWD
jgi:hypothetical protein